jgi:peroxiredoxin
MYGKKYMGTMRESFLLDKSGEIIYKWAKVSPASHPAETLEYIKILKH